MFATIATGTASASSGFKTLTGYSLADTGGVGATVTIRDGAGGNILRTITVLPYGDTDVQLGDNPIAFNGITFYFSVDYGTCRWTAAGRAA